MPWLVKFVLVNVVGPRVLRRVGSRWAGPPGSWRGRAVDAAVLAGTQYGRVRRVLFLAAIGVVAVFLAIVAAIVALLFWAIG